MLALRKSRVKHHTAPVKDATHTVLFRLHKVQNQKSNRSQNSGYILWVEDMTEGELRTLGPHAALSNGTLAARVWSAWAVSPGYSTFLCAYMLFIHKILKLGKNNRLASAIKGNTIVFLTVS